MIAFLKEKILTLGTAACPPYHLAVVIGGTSAEQMPENCEAGFPPAISTPCRSRGQRQAMRFAISKWRRRSTS